MMHEDYKDETKPGFDNPDLSKEINGLEAEKSSSDDYGSLLQISKKVSMKKMKIPQKQEKRQVFKTQNINLFSETLEEAKNATRPEASWRVSSVTPGEFEKEHPGAKCFITNGKSTFAVAKDGDIVAVCKHPDDRFRGKDLIKIAVDNGGIKLDSYEGNHDFYTKCGFEPVSWCKWDSEYAPPGWDDKRDSIEDIVFYKYTGNTDKRISLSEFKAKISPSVDYYAARDARDSTLKTERTN